MVPFKLTVKISQYCLKYVVGKRVNSALLAELQLI